MSRRRIEPPFKWNVDLEAEFERIVERLGKHSTASDILHEMSHVEGLNRQIVASHLREYRKRLRRGGSGGRQGRKRN